MKTTSASALASPSGAVQPLPARVLEWTQEAVRQQSLRWALFHPVAMMLGAAAYMFAAIEPEWPWLIGLAIVGVLGVVATRRRAGGLLAFLALASLSFAIGAISAKVRTASVTAPVLSREIGPVRIEGTVAEIDASDRSRRIRIDVRAIEGLSPEMTPRFVRVSVRGDVTIAPGRAVTCRAILSPPPRPVVPEDYAFHREAWFRQLGAVGFSIGQCEPLATTPPAGALQRIDFWIEAVRRAMASRVNDAAGQEGGGMSAAMVVGDRSFLTPEDNDVLRDSGLSHLLSISGVHMVLAGGMFFFIIRYLWPLIEPAALRVPAVKVAAAGAIIAVTLYFAISGASVATQRSYVMALIGFGAKLFDRPAISMRSLAIALAVVVLLQPESVSTPGFQMSFAASAALVALYEAWPRIDRPEEPGLFARARGWVVGAVATSVVASFATMPFALHHFERTAMLSVLANVAASPIISLWTTPAAAAAAIATPFGLQDIFLEFMGESLKWVLVIARWCSEHDPGADAPRFGGVALAFAGAAILLATVLDGRGRLVALAPAAISVGLWLTAPMVAGYVSNDGTVWLRLPNRAGWAELSDWRGEKGLAPLRLGDAPRVKPCPGKGAACEVAARAGVFVVEAVTSAAVVEAAPPAKSGAGAPAVSPDACPTTGRLIFTASRGQQTTLEPCALGRAGGAVLELDGATLRAHTAPDDRARPWGGAKGG